MTLGTLFADFRIRTLNKREAVSSVNKFRSEVNASFGKMERRVKQFADNSTRRIRMMGNALRQIRTQAVLFSVAIGSSLET